MTRIMLEAFVLKLIYMFIKTLDEIFKKILPKYTKIYPKRVHFWSKIRSVLSPLPKKSQLITNYKLGLT
jgi:hypothetical protein